MQMQMHTQLLAIEPRAGTSGFRSDEDEWLSAGSHLDPKPSNNSFQVQGSQQDPLLSSVKSAYYRIVSSSY
jgi:hypothetical protein